MKIRMAVAATPSWADDGGLIELVEGLEKRSFDTLWLSDTPLASGVQPLLALAVASGHSRRLKLGTNVVVPGRNPLLLAKELAHLDRLTGGRLLLAFMPGIGSARERAALGVVGVDRTARLERVIELCRAWWAGESVSSELAGWVFDDVTVEPPPVQAPLEIWLGGNGPRALHSTGTHADGWLGSRATPAQAEANRIEIERVAAEAGRVIDDDHFGISIPYARVAVGDELAAAVLRRTEADRTDILPVGPAELTRLLRRHLDAGLTKFVLRPLTVDDGWDVELDYLAEHTLPLQN